MTTIKRVMSFIGIVFLTAYSISAQKNIPKILENDINQNKLWYTTAATKWMEALPVGNGRLGAMVFGKIANETLQLNEESVWAGSPIQEGRAGASGYLDNARKLIFEGKYSEADNLVQDKVMGQSISPVSYQTLGNLNLKFDLPDKAENYKRELDIDLAIAKTTFTINGVTYTRKVFSSPVDQVLVVVISADKPKSITFDISLDRPADFQVGNLGKDKIRMWGQASQAGKNLGVKYETQVQAVPKSGQMKISNGKIAIRNADSVTLFLAAQTDYNPKNPYAPLKANLSNQCSLTLKAVSKKRLDKIIAEHVQEHQRLFRRMTIQLGTDNRDNIPTDVRLEALKTGADDSGLMALYFQFGRYLLLSSSRSGNLPANLQGIWNEHLAAPWNSDYHTNINMQMNYWLAEVTNLSECHNPFFTFIESLVPSGQKTAKTVYDANGFVVHHTTDVWHNTVPVGKIQYGMWPMGGAWCTQHFMEHYRFTKDTTFLKEHAYPILRESAKFLMDFLTKDPRSGKLVSGPSSSPENKFLTPKGNKEWANLGMGNAMDQEIIWDNFSNLLEAAKILNIQDDFLNDVAVALKNLSVPKIGSDGRLMEWSEEFGEVEAGHRHMSHLFGLYPGRQFNKEKTPYMIDAINKSIDYRLSNGGGHTGWSRAWIINFFARLKQPEKAYDNVKALLQKSTSTNLFDFHPPFQIDGNFGGTAGIAEMLLQSHVTDEKGLPIIDLLPALPKAWSSGNITGLKARGGFEIDMNWEDGKLNKVTVKSTKGGTCNLRFHDKNELLILKEGESRVLNDW